MKPTQSFLFYLTALTLILGLIILGLQKGVEQYAPGPFVWYALVFYYVLTYLLYQMAMLGLNRGNKTFTTGIFGSMLLRIIASILFLVIYLIINKEKDISFIATFLCLYLFFTIFEIFQLVRKLRPEKSRGIDNTID